MSKAKPVVTLTPEILNAFTTVLKAIVSADELNEQRSNHDGATQMLNDLFNSVPQYEFERFAQIIQDANDPEFRSPK